MSTAAATRPLIGHLSLAKAVASSMVSRRFMVALMEAASVAAPCAHANALFELEGVLRTGSIAKVDRRNEGGTLIR